jgi:hypothetical protein
MPLWKASSEKTNRSSYANNITGHLARMSTFIWEFIPWKRR